MKNKAKYLKKIMQYLLLTLACTLSSYATSSNVDRWVYCTGETENDIDVDGSCYMYSKNYGYFDGETENDEEVSGTCYQDSEGYIELEDAETESGKEVFGECYEVD